MLYFHKIALNAYLDSSNPFEWPYIIGMSITRLALPVYLWTCQDNIAMVVLGGATPMKSGTGKPTAHLAVALIIWVAFQIGVQYIQQRWDPRFFVPARFLPVKYNYRRSDPVAREEEDCVICMSEVTTEGTEHMITPCNHVYHAECLTRWMDVKMECPTCRAPLPNP